MIVVGGGLAGLSAAHTVLERGGRCLVIDKKDFLGGNSVKATSGINGTPTSTQAQQGIPDNAHVFYNDTALSAAGQTMNEQRHSDEGWAAFGSSELLLLPPSAPHACLLFLTTFVLSIFAFVLCAC